MKEAFLYSIEKSKVRCTACSRYCLLGEGQTGFCGVRKNIGGKLFLLVYGRAAAVAIDPIEKKPLFHYLPGARVLSMSTNGCSWACAYCQNYDLSQRREITGEHLTPEQVVEMAVESGSDGISYTYNEPSIFSEYAHDIGILARKHGIFSTFVSNGYETREAIPYLSEFLDAISIDFKGNGNDAFGRKYIGIMSYSPVFDTLKRLKRAGIYTEITDLVVPVKGIGDNIEDARTLARWIKDNLGPDVPLHFTRFHPDYRMIDVPVTPIDTLEKHYAVAKEEGIKFVYIGNIPGHPLENTYCPNCGKELVRRNGFQITNYGITADGRCPFCGEDMHIVRKGAVKQHQATE
ncbi:MAG: AmmeMemoRadiSam system radical SAM enzyme [Thermoplasmatales archaeon]|nr:AmmeMemoRadiSam system radical SAM enzyme [Thermoplasmatales archaeon]